MHEGSSYSESPRLSVLVCNYNYGRFLPRAIDSILSQSFVDFELIVVDNASTDNSQELLREYAARDERVQLVLRDENQGLLGSLRQACDVAAAPYVVYVNSDDWVLTPSTFDDQVRFLDDNPTASFVLSDLVLATDDGVIDVVQSYPDDTLVPGELSLEVLLGFRLTLTGMMFRQDAYHQTGGWPSENHHCSDQQLAARFAQVGDVGYLASELYAFHQHDGNYHMGADKKLIGDEILPMIDATFEGPLGERVPDAAKVRRRIEQKALVHRPTQAIFRGARKEGWEHYWESVRLKPILTIAQPRTISLVSRTLLGQRGHDLLRSALSRLKSKRSADAT